MADRETRPDREYVSDLNFMERYALDFLKRRTDRDGTDVHVWNDAEIAEVERQERRAKWLAALSGTVSGALIAGIELALREWLVEDMDTADWDELIPYWAAYLVIAGLITGIEIIYLYWLVLRMVARMSTLAGFSLSARAPERVTATGLSRAALDMPNPRTPFYGIDPYARIPRWQLLLYTLAYRAKVGVTSLIMRLLVRRILARAALRFIVPFIAIPVYAVWNWFIVRWVMREARVRAAGPIAIEQLADRIDARRDHVGPKEGRLLVALVGEAMMAARDAHPNFLLLLSCLVEMLSIEPDAIEVDWPALRDELGAADPPLQDLALDVLALACVLGGRPGRRQKRLLADARRASGRRFDAGGLDAVWRSLIDGQGMCGEPS